jgi:SAM-dependent methyltransferase
MHMNIDYRYHYAKYHHQSEGHRQWMVSFSRRILAPYLPERRGLPALDIGCGMGFAMLYLEEEGFAPVEGIDVDLGQIQSCLAKGLNVHQVDDAVGFVEQRIAHYGIILAMDLLEHLDNDEQLALTRAVSQALLPGGRFVCSVPNANSAVAARHRYIDFTHRCSFTEDSLDFLLYNSGFSCIEIFGYEFYQPPHQKGLGPQHFARRRHFLSYLFREYLRWGLRGLVRGWRRLEMIAEFGSDTGGSIPLSLNLLGVATRE